MAFDIDAIGLKGKQVGPTRGSFTFRGGDEFRINKVGPRITILLQDGCGPDDGAFIAVVDSDGDGVGRQSDFVFDEANDIGNRDDVITIILEIFHLLLEDILAHHVGIFGRLTGSAELVIAEHDHAGFDGNRTRRIRIG